MENIFVEFLPPWIETGLQPAFYDKESGTVLQQTARMYARVNMLIRMFNKLSKNTKTTVEDYIDQFNELHDYVHDYFDNLDVQEEINNKLDAMAEDGTLEDIIANRAFKDLDVENNYEIITRKITDSTRTLVYHKTILRPKNADYVALKGLTCTDSVADMEDNPINMFKFMVKKPNIFMSNSDSIGAFNGNTAIIRDGEKIFEGGGTARNVVAIDNQGQINVFDGNVTATQLLSSNYINSWNCSSLVRNGTKNVDAGEPTGDVRHPRTVLLQEYNSSDIVFLHIEGRRIDSVGVTLDECADLIIEAIPNVRCACSLGGGGDTQLMINGRMINDCNDNQLRPLYDVFYLDPNLANFTDPVSKEIGEGRISDVTLKKFLESRVNLVNNYLYSRVIAEARFINAAGSKNNFVCDIDYNTSLEPNDSIIITFPDITNNANIDADGGVYLNIHYANEVSPAGVRDEYNRIMKPFQISNRTLLLKWTGELYRVVTILPTVAPVSSVDLNTIKDNSLLYSSTFVNRPTVLGENVGAGINITLPLPIKNYAIQIYITRPSANIFVRTLENGVWGSWTRYMNEQRRSKNGQDLNTFINEFNWIYGNNMTNKPTASANGWAINLPGASEGYNAQIYIERKTTSANGRVFIRLQEGGTWDSWNQLAFLT